MDPYSIGRFDCLHHVTIDQRSFSKIHPVYVIKIEDPRFDNYNRSLGFYIYIENGAKIVPSFSISPRDYTHYTLGCIISRKPRNKILKPGSSKIPKFRSILRKVARSYGIEVKRRFPDSWPGGSWANEKEGKLKSIRCIRTSQSPSQVYYAPVIGKANNGRLLYFLDRACVSRLTFENLLVL